MTLRLIASSSSPAPAQSMQGYSVQLRESMSVVTLAEHLWTVHRECYCPADDRTFNDLPAATRNEFRRVATLALRMTVPDRLTAAYWRGAMDLHAEIHETGDWSALRGREQAQYWFNAKAAVYGFMRCLMGDTRPQEDRAVTQQLDAGRVLRDGDERNRVERALIQVPRI